MLAARAARAQFWLACGAALLLAPGRAPAGSLGQWDGFDLRLDTTVRVSLGLRLENADPSLLANINADDGDRAFRPGPMSERVDVVSELTGERGHFGFDISGQGWYDAAYNTESANNSAATFNPVTSSARGFPADVRDLMGRQAELLNAYVRDTEQIGDTPVTISAGRQTLLWGESLLFAENGIAAAQAPVDGIKSLAAPLAEARELFLPVAQIVARIGLGGGLSLEAYDQVEWRRNRLPGVGSYFSTIDDLDAGGQRILAAGGLPTLYRSGDDAPHGLGQFGVAVRQSGGTVDWGIYALRADARAPQLVLDPGYDAYHLAFARGIGIFGASLSTYAGDANVAGEISVHRNTPLDAVAGPAGLGAQGGGFTGGGGGGGNIYALVSMLPPPVAPRYGAPPPISLGTTVNAQASVQAQLPPGRFADGTSVQAEIAGNQLVGGTLPDGRTHAAAAARVVVTPQYFQVLPGLDLAAPVGFGIGLVGFSPVDASQNAGAGFVSVGVNATFHVVWQGGVSFTHFVGGAGGQPLADRDFAIVAVTRSF
jgi:hypothetical protein